MDASFVELNDVLDDASNADTVKSSNKVVGTISTKKRNSTSAGDKTLLERRKPWSKNSEG